MRSSSKFIRDRKPQVTNDLYFVLCGVRIPHNRRVSSRTVLTFFSNISYFKWYGDWSHKVVRYSKPRGE